MLSITLNKYLKKILKKNQINKDNFLIIDFIRCYLTYQFYKLNKNELKYSKDYKKQLKNIYEITDWKKIIESINENNINLIKLSDKNEKELFTFLLSSLVEYYQINDINYFFDKKYDEKKYLSEQKKYEKYLKLNDQFLTQLRSIIPSKAGSIYNIIKKYKKGV